MSRDNKKIRPEKKAMYNEVQENVSGALYMLLTDYKGMTMPQTDEFKKLLRGADARVKVVKNSMLGRISSDMGCDLSQTLSGPTAVIYGSGDLEGAILSAKDVGDLATMPGKKELQARLVGTVAAPMTQLVGVMNQKVCSLLYVLKAVAEKKETAA
ncbi:MAG: 50S ribosomal protein L10 [Pontiellaceae bacterium]|nr:50S ribosomal protein L10 [Pontiellaceae bacterium]